MWKIKERLTAWMLMSQVPTHPTLIDLLIINPPMMHHPPLTRSHSNPQHPTPERLTRQNSIYPNLTRPKLSSHDSRLHRILQRIHPYVNHSLENKTLDILPGKNSTSRAASTSGGSVLSQSDSISQSGIHSDNQASFNGDWSMQADKQGFGSSGINDRMALEWRLQRA